MPSAYLFEGRWIMVKLFGEWISILGRLAGDDAFWEGLSRLARWCRRWFDVLCLTRSCFVVNSSCRFKGSILLLLCLLLRPPRQNLGHGVHVGKGQGNETAATRMEFLNDLVAALLVLFQECIGLLFGLILDAFAGQQPALIIGLGLVDGFNQQFFLGVVLAFGGFGRGMLIGAAAVGGCFGCCRLFGSSRASSVS